MKARPIKKRGVLVAPEGYYLVENGNIKFGDLICCPKSPHPQYRIWHSLMSTKYSVENNLIINNRNGHVPFVPHWFAAKKIGT